MIYWHACSFVFVQRFLAFYYPKVGIDDHHRYPLYSILTVVFGLIVLAGGVAKLLKGVGSISGTSDDPKNPRASSSERHRRRRGKPSFIGCRARNAKAAD